MADPVPGSGQSKSLYKAWKALHLQDYNRTSATNPGNISLRSVSTGSALVTEAGAVAAGRGIANVPAGKIAPYGFNEVSNHQTETVLCTELHKQGILSDEIYRKDSISTKEWLSKRPFLKASYLSAAYWPLWLLRNKKKFAKKYMHHVIVAMSVYYADIQTGGFKFKKKNVVGYLMILFGLTMLAPVGILAKISRNKTYRLMLSTLIFIIWFLPLFTFSLVIKFIKKIKKK